MVSAQVIDEQLKKIGFNKHGWGTAEVRELPHIILPDEEIYECVNGLYEGGFALLVATDVRVLLIDKKPFNYLTVEDLRFDMINEIDYSHRMFGAYISITSGDKNMKFRSYNQPRLRKLINHVQHCMAASKKQQNTHQKDQKQHLEAINQQLQAYLKAQYDHQQDLREQLKQAQSSGAAKTAAELQVEAPKPSPELSDYLFAQSLLNQYQEQTGQPITSLEQMASGFTSQPLAAQPVVEAPQPPALAEVPSIPAGTGSSQLSEIYAEGMQEVFGKRQSKAEATDADETQPSGPSGEPSQQSRSSLHLPNLPSMPSMPNLPSMPTLPSMPSLSSLPNPLEINPLRIAYSKLPMALRNRKFSQHPSTNTFPSGFQSKGPGNAEPKPI